MSYVHAVSPLFFLDEDAFLTIKGALKNPKPLQQEPKTPPMPIDGIIAYDNKMNNVFAYKIDKNEKSGDLVYKRLFGSLRRMVQQKSDEILQINFKMMRGKMNKFNGKNKFVFIDARTFCNVSDNSRPIFDYFLLKKSDIENDTYKNKVYPYHFDSVLGFLVRDFVDRFVDIPTMYKSFVKKVKRRVMHTYNIVSFSDPSGTNTLRFTAEGEGIPALTFVFDYETFFVHIYPHVRKSKINHDMIFNGAPFEPPFAYARFAKPFTFPVIVYKSDGKFDDGKFVVNLNFLE